MRELRQEFDIGGPDADEGVAPEAEEW